MVAQFVVQWSGARIGSGVSVFHADSVLSDLEATGFNSRLRTFFEAIKGAIPDEVFINYPLEARQLNATTGDLTGVFTLNSLAATQGGASTAYANGTGAMIRLSTTALAGNRRLLGRLFIVPMSAGGFSTDGDVIAATRSQLDQAASTLMASSAAAAIPWVVWSRTYGVVAPVSSVQTQPRPSHLSTRNDR